MAAGPRRHMVTLSCRHTRYYNDPAPAKGDDVFCVKCNDIACVRDAPAEWRVSCTECPYGRVCGAARLDCEMRATRHHRKHGHVVHIYNGHEHVVTLGDERQRETRRATALDYLHQRQQTLFSMTRDDTTAAPPF